MTKKEVFIIGIIIVLLIFTIVLVTPSTEKEYKIITGNIDSVSVGINEERISYLNVSINNESYNLVWGTWVNEIIIHYSENPYYTIEMFRYITPPQENDIWRVTTVVIA